MKKETIARIFRHVPRLRTERLLLRRIEREDATDVYSYASLPEVTRFLLWEPHPNLSYSKTYVDYLQDVYRAGSFYDWGVILLDSGHLIGTCGFTSFDFENNSAQIGYVLHSEHHGKGIATEAVSAVLDFGFRKLKLQRIEGRYMEENHASRRVMEKNGMHFEGILRNAVCVRGEYVNVGVCSILRDEFFAKDK
ncbi:MAG: GNAT family N-acetyltransferase [Clostridia bacterium]|nr:GNAT family N-acetyltransferase [Clostridia bacterium]